MNGAWTTPKGTSYTKNGNERHPFNLYKKIARNKNNRSRSKN
jgi:hypothetical protein